MHSLAPIVLLVCAAALSSCIRFGDGTTTTVSESISFADEKQQAAFERGLTDAGIPFKIEMRDGMRHAVWTPEHAQAAGQVKLSIVGEPLPADRHIAFAPPERQEEFKSWLREQGIPFTTRVSRDREYVIWYEAHTDKVTSWEKFGPRAGAAPDPRNGKMAPGHPPGASHVKQ